MTAGGVIKNIYATSPESLTYTSKHQALFCGPACKALHYDIPMEYWQPPGQFARLGK
jgi:hypothetical protein